MIYQKEVTYISYSSRK